MQIHLNYNVFRLVLALYCIWYLFKSIHTPANTNSCDNYDKNKSNKKYQLYTNKVADSLSITEIRHGMGWGRSQKHNKSISLTRGHLRTSDLILCLWWTGKDLFILDAKFSFNVQVASLELTNFTPGFKLFWTSPLPSPEKVIANHLPSQSTL